MTDSEITLRLLLSLLFGAIVGIERQWHHKNAGLKTNTLVAVGATAFTLLSQHGFSQNNNPSHVAAGVVTGIGFIGAGVIIRRGGSIQGINTAATLWATASIGMAIGSGFYALAWRLFGVVVLIQFLMRWIGNLIDKYSGMLVSGVNYQVAVKFLPTAAERVLEAWSAFTQQSGVSISRYNLSSPGEAESKLEASLCLSELRSRELSALGHRFMEIIGVTACEWSTKAIEEGD